MTARLLPDCWPRKHRGEPVLRDPGQDGKLVTISKRKIDEQKMSPVSIMPEGLVNQLSNRQQFLDLVKFLIEIAQQGPARALELRPDDAATHLQLADTLARVGRRREAQTEYERLASGHDTPPDIKATVRHQLAKLGSR